MDICDWGFRDRHVEVLDRGFSFGGGSRGEIDAFGIVFGDLEDGFFTKSDIAGEC